MARAKKQSPPKVADEGYKGQTLDFATVDEEAPFNYREEAKARLHAAMYSAVPLGVPAKRKGNKMPFITESLDDVREPQAAPEGEYELRIVKATRGPSKKGNDMITAILVFEDQDLAAPPFAHYLIGYDEDTDKDQIRNRKLEWKRWCACFDLPEDCDESDMVGQTGMSFVNQEEGDDGVVRNRLRLPRLKE
jgi:hypothetical protein